MNTQYTLSIIIPHYQSFDFLRTCLSSIPNADFIQVIVIDDKSPDWMKFEEGLKQDYPYVNFQSAPKNGGAGAARNLGLQFASGKWLMFADADDYFTPNAFDIIKESFDSKADIVYFEADSIDLATGMSSDRHQHINSFVDAYDSQNEVSEGNLRFRCYGPVCKMIRRTVVTAHQIQFDEVKYANDVMFSAKVGYYAKTITAVKQPIYCITTSSNSLTRKMTAGAIMCRYSVSVNFHLFLRNIGKEKYQGIILRYFILAIKYAPSCIIPMLKIGLKYRVNFLAGLHRWRQVLDRNKKNFSHF